MRRPVSYTHLPDEYATVLLKAQGAQSELDSLERERFAMDQLQLGATMLAEWGMPEMLIHAAYHHEEPDAADFADGSRLQTLTHSLNFARSLAEVCMADEESVSYTHLMLLPAFTAHMLAPLPRCRTTVRPCAARGSSSASTDAMYSYERPWKP